MQTVSNQAPIIVISGSIGSGKGTVLHALLHELNVTWIPTHTTRPVRKDDHVLSRRIFDTESTFARHESRNEFIETIELAGYRYGLLRHDLETGLRTHKGVVLELTVEGGGNLAKMYSNTFLIFLQSEERYRRERVADRHLDHDVLQERMHDAKREEKLAQQHYDYIIENAEDNPNEAIDAIKKLIVERFPDLEKHHD